MFCFTVRQVFSVVCECDSEVLYLEYASQFSVSKRKTKNVLERMEMTQRPMAPISKGSHIKSRMYFLQL